MLEPISVSKKRRQHLPAKRKHDHVGKFNNTLNGDELHEVYEGGNHWHNTVAAQYILRYVRRQDLANLEDIVAKVRKHTHPSIKYENIRRATNLRSL